MELTVFTGILIALCGVVVGILSAMFGVGGGTIMIPLIHLAFGQPAAVASGTSIFAILPTSLTGIFARRHDGTIHIRVGLAIGIAGACVSPLGAVVASNAPGEIALGITAIIILFTAFNMFRRVYRARPQAQHDAEKTSRRAVFQDARGVRLYGSCIGLGLITGFLSGYLGLGGGFLVVPFLQILFGFAIKAATGTSLIAVALFAIPSFITHAILGNVAWIIGVLLIIGSIVGAQIGAVLVRHVHDRLLTLLFGILLVVSGVILALQQIVG